MIESTFSCFRGISLNLEMEHWERGCLRWNDLKRTGPVVQSYERYLDVLREMEQAEIALGKGRIDYFLDRMQDEVKPRVYHNFQKSIGYIDIETTGLKSSDQITTIALYCGDHISLFVNGINLNDFLNALRNISLLVSFNGLHFDIPMIHRHFNCKLHIPHLDLRPLLSLYGFNGALKSIEKKLNIERSSYQGLSGIHAVTIWNDYQKKREKEILETLLRYNCEDVLTLERLMVFLYNRSMSTYPLKKKVAFPVQPSIDQYIDIFFSTKNSQFLGQSD